MTLSQYKYIYFLGIGGIGMSALARWFNVNGFEVAGYDRTATPLTDALANEGVSPHFIDDIAQIPLHFRQNIEQTLVILTPAIPKNHIEYNYLKDNGFTIQKRSQVLGLLASGMFTIAVAGTHGKTTTSAMVSHLLRHSEVNCAAFLGGITQNYGTNLLINEPTDELSSVYCVVEADEFDRSFLTLYPNIAIVTSTDADHLDIYGDHSALLDSFGLFVAQIKPDGHLLMRAGLQIADKTLATVGQYAIDSGQYHAQNVRIEDACFVFDFVSPAVTIENLVMQVPGYHNVENMVAAIAVALKIGISREKIKAAVASFGGVKRRFEYHLKSPQCVFIDDYAHHPTEVSAFLKSVKGLYPDRHVTAIFQPHLFSRTRDFAEGFAHSLSIADRVILLDIYPARELPIEGVTSQIIFKDITTKDKIQCSKNELLDLLKTLQKDVVVTIGAGDIDTQILLIKEQLSINAKL
jgi:UDP-N-acetylmuramate--alanine ligase